MKVFATLLLMGISISLIGQISNNGLLAYYPFDGDVADYGPNSYDGVNAGGVFSSDAQGNAAAALLLDGISDYVNMTAFGPSFRDNLGQMTILFKFRFDEEGDDQTILSLGNSGEGITTNVFEVEYEKNRFQVETETGISAVNHELEIDQTASLFTGEWHYMMITLDGENLSYCRDGEVVFQGVYTPAETTSSTFYVGGFAGNNPNSCCFYGGAIDDLQFYDRILTEDELAYFCTPCVEVAGNLLVTEDFESETVSARSAAQNLSSTSTIFPDASVVFRAGDTITLATGFTTLAGSEFKAYIDDCVDNTVFAKSVAKPDERPEQSIANEAFDLNTDGLNQREKSTLSLFPNPLSTQAQIKIQLEETTTIYLNVFDANGKLIQNLLRGNRFTAGEHTLNFDAQSLAPGVYFLQFISQGESKVLRMLISK